MFTLCFIFVLAAGIVQGDVCSYVATKDCSRTPKEVICGTNGNSYNNQCVLNLTCSESCDKKTNSVVKGDVCAYVLTRDCAFQRDFTHVCGTDGTSYRNHCFLAKAYCADNSIHKAHDGPCVAPTTPSPIHGSEVALDIFCLDLLYIKCPVGGTQICGSDGTFYDNICEFDKARCFHRDLQDNGTNCS